MTDTHPALDVAAVPAGGRTEAGHVRDGVLSSGTGGELGFRWNIAWHCCTRFWHSFADRSAGRRTLGFAVEVERNLASKWSWPTSPTFEKVTASKRAWAGPSWN